MELFGFSHFLILIEIPVVIVTAYLLHKHLNYEKTVVTVSFVLFVLEIFKQIYLYILKGTVSLWDIPFQLCSIPIYYWLIYPKSKHKDILEAFLIDFNGLGAILSFLYPEGMIHKEVILTAHSFLFHDAVLFISLLTLFKGKGRCEFRKEIPFYLLLCLMAEIINFSLNGYGEIDMFYINPLVKMNQPVFKDIALYIGIPFTCVLYVFVLGLGAYIIHIFRRSVDLNN